MSVIVNVNTEEILRKRGLGSSNDAVQFLAQDVKDKCDPYVPFESGTLKNGARVTADSVLYSTPYAHYQYTGMVMGGVAPKHYTGQPLTYHNDAGTRGPQWDKRMMADRGEEIVSDFARFIGGTPV